MMSVYSKAQLGWMWHGVTLGQMRIDRPHVLARFMSEEQIEALRWETATRRRILEHIEQRLPLDNVMQVVAGYMVTHADLQIARHAQQIDEATFFSRCYTARDQLMAHPLVVDALKRLPKPKKEAA